MFPLEYEREKFITRQPPIGKKIVKTPGSQKGSQKHQKKEERAGDREGGKGKREGERKARSTGLVFGFWFFTQLQQR